LELILTWNSSVASSDDFVSLQILLPNDFFARGFSILMLMYSSSEYFKHYPVII